MSGGVDSSVAAVLSLAQGWNSIGATLKLFNGGSRCCSLEDINDARAVANRLDIPHYVFNFTELFRKEVIERFIASYERGDTPNPCIDCNRSVKWQGLMHRMKEIDFDCIVTGHYARIEASGSRYLLKKGLDPKKDQSYVLYMLTQEELAHTRLPLGGLSKQEVREMALENNLLNARKTDSQDICFVPREGASSGDYGAFIEQWTAKTYPEGTIVGMDGSVLGRHRGYVRYTIGQRRGLGVAANEPLYVCAKNPATNTLVLGPEESLYSKSLSVSHINLIPCDSLPAPLKLRVMTRYQAHEALATVRQTAEDEIQVVFDEPQRAVTSGQAAVFYDGDTVVGGGTIARVSPCEKNNSIIK